MSPVHFVMQAPSFCHWGCLEHQLICHALLPYPWAIIYQIGMFLLY